MVGIGILDKAQALAGGIDLAKGGSNRFGTLGRERGISRAEHADEPSLDFWQQGQRGFTTTGLLSVHTDTVKNQRRGKRRQRGDQKKGTPLEAEPQHMNGSFGKSTARPAEHC